MVKILTSEKFWRLLLRTFFVSCQILSKIIEQTHNFVEYLIKVFLTKCSMFAGWTTQLSPSILLCKYSMNRKFVKILLHTNQNSMKYVKVENQSGNFLFNFQDFPKSFQLLDNHHSSKIIGDTQRAKNHILQFLSFFTNLKSYQGKSKVSKQLFYKSVCVYTIPQFSISTIS